MTSRGRGVTRGRGRGGASTGGDPAERRQESPNPSRGRGRGGTPSHYPRGGTNDPGSGRGLIIRGGPPRGRGQASIFMHGQQADIDSRIADNSDKMLVASFNVAGSASDPYMPLRPDFGTVGREVVLRTNFFPVQVHQQTPSLKLYEYHVAITPVSGSYIRRERKRIYELAERTTAWGQAGMTGQVVHDNSARLFSAFALPQPLTIEVPYYNDGESGPPRHTNGRVYTLKIMIVQEIDTGHLASYLAGQMEYRDYNWLPVVSALSLILMSLPRKMSIATWRNRYFLRRIAEPFGLGGGVEAWKGICISVRPTCKQLMVNVDVCTAPFYVPSTLAYAMNTFQDEALHVQMTRVFRNAQIEAMHLGCRRHRTIRKLVPLTARTCSFDSLEYGRVTVEDYFRRKFNIRLQCPDLGLAEVGGPMGREIYLPAELCNILPGQLFRGRLPEQQAAVMSTVASRCQPAQVHGETVTNQLRHQLGLDVIRPELESFGFTISSGMAVIPGRILSKPGITYASSATASIGDRASWSLLGVKFAVGACLDNWTVLVIEDGASRDAFTGLLDGDLREAVSAFCNMCNASGMCITADPTYATAKLHTDRLHDPMRQEAIRTIKDALLNVKPKPAIVLVMLANQDSAIYEGIKYLCDVRLDVATVCVQSAKIRKRNPQYLAHVALKVNTKLGGINHRLDGSAGEWLKSALTMVVGTYVTHPSLGSSEGCPSISAVVASVDSDFAQYPVILDIQESRLEMIRNLKEMMVDRLKLFQRKNDGKLPDRILIYRSGISENHFNHVRETEVPPIIEAFAAFNLGEPYRPKFSIIVCNKSRHVRFYPTDQGSATGDGNPLPGTVVDRGITAVYDFDFFLQSHGSGAGGITRPTHYYVIYDEIKFTADEIQGATNALSYMSARTTQAVSMVPPVYYADAACRRGRCYLRKLFHGCIDDDATMVSGTQSESREAKQQDVMQEARRLWGWGVAGALKETMFYL